MSYATGDDGRNELEVLADELREKLPPFYENPRELTDEEVGYEPPRSQAEAATLELKARALPVLQEARATLETPGWEYLTQAFNRTIEQRLEAALNAKTAEEVAELRGQVLAYREFLALPSTLKKQAEQGHEAMLRLGSRPSEEDTLEEGGSA